ncbi:MAG: M20 family metallopeptidase [Eubacteriales bacterium]|nr:M20 family metallopeptidase [Eubacteriales bacterium]
MKKDISHLIDNVFEEVVTIRRQIHSNPELSGNEVETAALISNILNKYNISHETGIAGNGIIATIGTGTKPCVGIRADIDALPIHEENIIEYASKKNGIMHACGHDLHTAILIGTGIILKNLEKDLEGTVKLIFEPSEETTGGAKPMIEAGCLLNPRTDTVIGLHVDPSLPSGQIQVCHGIMNAASTEFTINIKGVSCHGAHPEKGVDAIIAASNIVISIQTISSRLNSATTPVIVTIGQFNSGTKGNIIAGSATLIGIIRALSNETREKIKKQLKQIVESTAAAHGATAEIIFNDSYPSLINDQSVTSIVENAAKACLGEDKISYMKEPSLGADDFAYFANYAKASYFNLGTNTPGVKDFQSLHSSKFLPDENSMKAGILVEVEAVLKLLKLEV